MCAAASDPNRRKAHTARPAQSGCCRVEAEQYLPLPPIVVDGCNAARPWCPSRGRRHRGSSAHHVPPRWRRRQRWAAASASCAGRLCSGTGRGVTMYANHSIVDLQNRPAMFLDLRQCQYFLQLQGFWELWRRAPLVILHGVFSIGGDFQPSPRWRTTRMSRQRIRSVGEPSKPGLRSFLCLSVQRPLQPLQGRSELQKWTQERRRQKPESKQSRETDQTNKTSEATPESHMSLFGLARLACARPPLKFICLSPRVCPSSTLIFFRSVFFVGLFACLFVCLLCVCSVLVLFPLSLWMVWFLFCLVLVGRSSVCLFAWSLRVFVCVCVCIGCRVCVCLL